MKKCLFLLSIACLILLQFSLSAQPTITSFAPSSGPIGTSVVITGTNFSTTPANNIVFFGAVKANVTAATATSLTVTVPAGTTYKPISVTTGGLVAYSAKPFNVTFPGGTSFSQTSFNNTPVDFTTPGGPLGAASGDLDGDGKADLAVANNGNGSGNTFSVFRNTSTTGNISTATRQDFTTPTAAAGILMTDVDGDGKLDVVVTINTQLFSVFRNTSTSGAISFAARVDIGSGTGSGNAFIRVNAHDMDGDGKTDIILSYGALVVVRNTSTIGAISFASFLSLDPTVTDINYDTVIGDLDGDGKPDIAVAGYATNTLPTYLNTSTPGTLSFAPEVDFTVGSAPSGIVMSDFDGDGKSDIAVSNYSSGTSITSLFRNTSSAGAISLSAQPNYTTQFGAWGSSGGDIDGDGKPDLILATGGVLASLLRNNSSAGAISFEPEFQLSTNTNYIPLLTDLDNDGKPEIVIAGVNQNKLSVFRNKVNEPIVSSFSPTNGGTGMTMTITGSNFTGATSVSIGGIATTFTVVSPTSITAVIPANSSGSVAVSNSSGSGTKSGFTFVTPPTITSFTPTSGSTGNSITITGTNFTGATSVSIGGISATFFTVNSATSITAIIDAGASGNVSATTAGGTGSLAGFTFLPGPAITSFSPVSGPVGTSVTITGTNFSATASNNIVFFGAVKANVTAATTTSLTVTVPVGATYQPISVIRGGLVAYSIKPFSVTFSGAPLTLASFSSMIDFPAVSPGRLSVGDFNLDGKPDVVTTNYLAGTGATAMSLLRNTSTSGNLSFLAEPTLTNGGPIDIFSGDFDNDGKLDLVVVNINSGKVSVYLNTTVGAPITFAFKVDLTPGAGPTSIMVSDFDMDGRTDIAITNHNSDNTVSIFRNIGTGAGNIAFSSAIDFTTDHAPNALSVSDFDGDGKPDLAVANGITNTVSVLRNTSTAGTISFATQVPFTTGVQPSYIASGDLDGDGKPDVVVTNYNSGSYSLSLFKNTSLGSGNINFATKLDLSTSSLSTNGISLTDLDGDGKLDLALANYLVRNMSSIGTLSFDPIIDLKTYQNLSAMACDMDGDGKPDVITNQGTANKVSVFRNQTNEPLISSLSPTTGAIGTTITITGTNFTGATSVKFGGTAASSFTVVSPTSITAVVGTGASGVVSVTTPSGTQTHVGFTFDNTPFISSYAPSSAGVGATVTITGTNFTGTTSVTFGGVATTSFSVVSSTSITAVVPLNSSGSVSVISPYGTSTKTGFTFIPAPTVTSFTPTSASTGSSITITGTNFTGATAVSIGGVNTTSFTVNSPTLITTIIDIATTGSVLVTTPGGTGSLAGFTFLPAPTITSFSPVSGAVGSSVTIMGSNFDAASANNIVYFGAVRAAVTSATTTSLTVTVPSGATYQSISVTTANHTAYSAKPYDVTFTGIALGANSFDQGVAFSTGSYPQKPAIADLDNDGKPEIIFANNNSNSFSIIPNTGGSGVIALGNKIDVATSAGTSAASPGDLDGDGKLEIVTSINGTITAYRNTSASGISFTSISNVGFTGISGPFTILIQDLDGDGRPEVIATGNNTVSVFRNISSSSTLSFNGPFNFTINGLAVNLSSGDIDGDGKPDIALTASGNLFSVLRNTSTLGNISFAPRVDIAAGSLPYGIALVDLDNDGKLDIVTNSNIAPNTTVSIFKNISSPGSISFDVKQDIPTPVTSVKINTGDIDGDGKIDLFTSGGAYLLHNTSTGGGISFDSPITYSNMGGTDIALGDMDGNGKLDVVMVSTSGSYLFRNQINEPIITSFSPHTAGPGTVVTINGFNLDLAAISFGGTAASSVTTISSTQTTAVVGAGSSGQLKVVTPTGVTFANGFNFFTGPIISSFTPVSGVPGSTVTIRGSGFSTTTANNIVRFGATVAQVTSATTFQLVVKVPASAIVAPITVTTGNLTGYSIETFSATSSKLSPLTTGTFSKNDVAAASPQAIATGDFDDDGKTDLAVIDGTDLVSVFGNTSSVSSITLGAGIDLTTGSTPVAITTGDFNLDGKLDIAVANSGVSTVSIFKNTSSSGTISFAAKVDFTVSTNPQGISTGDLDGDARPDIVTSNFTSSSLVSVLLNSDPGDGSISFSSKLDFTAGSFPTDVAISDLDGDAYAEMIVTNSNAGTVTIFKNTITNGILSFQPRTPITTGNFPLSVVAGDITGDGWVDFVVANNGSSNITVFKNNGDGNLNFIQNNYTTANGPWDVALGDMNGDGTPDINVACSSGNVVSTLVSTSGNFFPKIDYATGAGTYGVVAVDLDGDGTTDMAAVNNTANSISLLRNSLPSLTSFSPLSAAAGTTVTITGINLSSVSSVSFGGSTATSFNIVSPTSITAVVPSNAISGNVTVNSPAGSISLPGFVFIPKPTILSFTPVSAAEGATVVITGAFFSGATSVNLGGTTAASFNVVSAANITVVVGTGASGDVSVTTPGGTATLSGFTFIPPPTVTSFSPAIGGPDMIITLTGTNFTGATAVSFGGKAAASFTVSSATTIQAKLAAGSSGDITVTSPGGMAKISGFIFDATVTAIDPITSPNAVEVEIYPNPVRDQEVNLKLGESWRGKTADIVITDTSGSQTHATSITCAETNTVVVSSNSPLKPGMYIITLQSEQKRARVKLIVIE